MLIDFSVYPSFRSGPGPEVRFKDQKSVITEGLLLCHNPHERAEQRNIRRGISTSAGSASD